MAMDTLPVRAIPEPLQANFTTISVGLSLAGDMRSYYYILYHLG
ncbi:hypothetical protein [Paenibacillus sp. FSL K6-2862]